MLTVKQTEALNLLASTAIYLLLDGGSRSGKTYVIIYAMVKRALKAPGARQAILRFRFAHIKSSIVYDTFPKVMENEFPNVTYNINRSDWFATFPNGSEIWFGGLDDKHRTEKILGNEYISIFFNESSQISWSSVGIVISRLAQKVFQVIQDRQPVELQPRLYFDCNPPNKLHWIYLLFKKFVDPDTKEALPTPSQYVSLKMNPRDNEANLTSQYLETLKGLPARLRKRFFDGEYADATPNALFSDDIIETYRVTDGKIPQMVRIVVAVDPSGASDTDNADNDEIGIVVAGLGQDGNAYLLEDCTIKAGPATWGRVATTAFDRWKADIIVAEINYGGAMVQHTIQTSRPKTPFLMVTASRGKHVRAEPISALYEQGKVRHVGRFVQLEDELSAFTTFGFVGPRSPNRADALVWALSALFPGIVAPTKKAEVATPIPTVSHFRQRF